MTKARLNPWTNYKDISCLTKYEEAIYNLLTEGKTVNEIAQTLNNKPMSIKSRIPAIREKVALREMSIKQARYPNFL